MRIELLTFNYTLAGNDCLVHFLDRISIANLKYLVHVGRVSANELIDNVRQTVCLSFRLSPRCLHVNSDTISCSQMFSMHLL